jgi:carboxypeptidase C (cathepsin A)
MDLAILWTNGGPDCGSSLGFYMELSPCRIVGPDSKPKHNPFPWNAKASLTNPVDWDYGEHVGTTEDAALDITAFLAGSFQFFDKFKRREFHLAGGVTMEATYRFSQALSWIRVHGWFHRD